MTDSILHDGDDVGCDCCPPTNLGFGIKVSIAAIMGILVAILLL